MGFAPSEVFLAQANDESALDVEGVVAGQKTWFRVSTDSGNVFGMTENLVEKIGLKQDAAYPGCVLVPDVEILGCSLSGHAFPYPHPRGPRTQGWLRAWFFRTGLLALDFAGPAVALSFRGEVRPLLPDPDYRLVLVSDSENWAPVTSDLRDGHTGRALMAHLDPGCSYSYVRRSYLAATRPKRKRERKDEKKGFKVSDVTLLLPDGNPVNLIAKVTDELPNAPPMSTGEGCEMKLGVDFLRRFLTIFDFAQQDVLLFTYG